MGGVCRGAAEWTSSEERRDCNDYGKGDGGVMAWLGRRVVGSADRRVLIIIRLIS